MCNVFEIHYRYEILDSDIKHNDNSRTIRETCELDPHGVNRNPTMPRRRPREGDGDLLPVIAV